MVRWRDLFTPRQLVALTTLSDLVGEAMERVRGDAAAAGLPDDDAPLRDGGTGARAYAQAVAVYLGLGVDRLGDRGSSICTWDVGYNKIRNTFSRQAIPMTWDYAECNPFSAATGNWTAMVNWTAKALAASSGTTASFAHQVDARSGCRPDVVTSTDPPYYDNIGYADLSDFFYVWLRRSLRTVFPHLFATIAVPKAEELVATPYRHGSRDAAEAFFLAGMKRALGLLAAQAHPGFPITVFYAFKQSERNGGAGVASTGWETFLNAAIQSGLSITGTWPMRTELANRMVGQGTNALASSIVLVCRCRSADAPLATRRELLAAIRRELPPALRLLRSGNIAPVDLAQAAIGPGMAVYTRYGRVLDAMGEPVKVREALEMINQIVDESLAEVEGEFNADTRWALAWYEDRGFEEGDFGQAETLSKAKNTSVSGLVEAGILESGGGRVRLLRPSELPSDWDPSTDDRSSSWEIVHHIIRVLEADGERAASELARRIGSAADVARDLAYRLYSIAERKRRAAEALQYNSLVGSWSEIKQLASVEAPAEQRRLPGMNNPRTQ